MHTYSRRKHNNSNILQQLSQAGYHKHQIQHAIENVNNENDINEIIDYIDKHVHNEHKSEFQHEEYVDEKKQEIIRQNDENAPKSNTTLENYLHIKTTKLESWTKKWVVLKQSTNGTNHTLILNVYSQQIISDFEDEATESIIINDATIIKTTCLGGCSFVIQNNLETIEFKADTIQTKNNWLQALIFGVTHHINDITHHQHECYNNIEHQFDDSRSSSSSINGKPTQIYVRDLNRAKTVQAWNENINSLNIDSVTMQTVSSQNCDAWFVKNCPQAQRVLFVLQYFQKWINHKTNNIQQKSVCNSMSELMTLLPGYSFDQLWNDFHHLKNHHMNVNQLDKTDDIYKYFKTNSFCNYHDNNCPSFKRKTQYKNHKDREGLYFLHNIEGEAEEVNIQNLLDTIHVSLIHDNVKNMTLSNKFVTSFSEEKKEAEDELYNDDEKEHLLSEDEIETDNPYGFGVPFNYINDKWPQFCPRKYLDGLKQEFLNNGIYKLDKFDIESLIKQAEIFIKTNEGRKMVAKRNGCWNEDYSVKKGTPISIEHIMVLLSYCNYDMLQREYKKTYRKTRKNESRKSISKRHYEIANWAKLLSDCLTFYSVRMTGENDTVYHGINQRLKFDRFEPAFFCPISTTVVRQIAYNFATNNGIILSLSKSSGRPPVYMNMTYLSDYPREEERLFVYAKLSFTNIICEGISGQFHIKCLKLFQKIVNGSFLSHCGQLIQMNYQQGIIQMIQNCMKCQIIFHDVPKYLQDLFDYYAKKIKFIWFNESEFDNIGSQLQSYFVNVKKAAFLKRESKISLGTFSSFLNNYMKNNITIIPTSVITWNISGDQLKLFWKNQPVRGPSIKCSIHHFSNDKSFFTLATCCLKSTNHTKDGRFQIRVQIQNINEIKKQYKFKLEFEIYFPQIGLCFEESAEDNQVKLTNLFPSRLLKNMDSVTINMNFRVVHVRLRRKAKKKKNKLFNYELQQSNSSCEICNLASTMEMHRKPHKCFHRRAINGHNKDAKNHGRQGSQPDLFYRSRKRNITISNQNHGRSNSDQIRRAANAYQFKLIDYVSPLNENQLLQNNSNKQRYNS